MHTIKVSLSRKWKHRITLNTYEEKIQCSSHSSATFKLEKCQQILQILAEICNSFSTRMYELAYFHTFCICDSLSLLGDCMLNMSFEFPCRNVIAFTSKNVQ